MPFQKSLLPPPTAVIPLSAIPDAPQAAIETGEPPEFSPPASLSSHTVCRIVSYVTAEMVALLGVRVQVRVDRRRTLAHVRQVSMYLCHVALRIPQHDVGLAFGLDRKTVGHACLAVERRRDQTAYDDFVCAMERILSSIFVTSEIVRHD
ncbi:helix-turn-helix domain-containing protein [Rhizobium sp. RAF56]|jgi:hypothetical protein|uniref:helix-turn-helix domain-containing protein n=1 Tax=Rhizobium sp. RAF56 TaxID=3233062 RepID=UPI003F98693C